MSLRLLLRDHPRSIALATPSHALIFGHSLPGQSSVAATKSAQPRCMVTFSAVETVDLSDYQPVRPTTVYGTLGLININTDIFLSLITDASLVATVRPGETVQRISSVEFYCLNRGDYDPELEGDVYPGNGNDGASEGLDYGKGNEYREAPAEHPCLALKKILSGGTFYYSVDFDLTNRLQNRLSEESAFDIDSLDDGFLWNSYMIDPLIQFRSRLGPNDRKILDDSRILTSAIRGYVSTVIVPASSSPFKAIGSHLPSTLTVMSRLSCRRAGTRFNARGIDDDGNVANFVETETVYWFPTGLCFSYAQVRGSVPVFWEQATGFLPQQQKIQITRSIEATQPAFDKHFEDLELKYGAIHILNLLSESKPGEVELTERFKLHVRQSPLYQRLSIENSTDRCLLRESQFDFHAETKGPAGYEAASMVRQLVENFAESFLYFQAENIEESDLRSRPNLVQSSVALQQLGVFRTNCLDCLDRTNLIQTILSQMALELFLSQGHGHGHALSDFWMRHSTLWADNGDSLSKIYAGTGALKSSFTRHGKMSLAGAFADARKSATRVYINNFVDKGRQNTIDILLGRLVDQSPVQLYDPINDYVAAELKKRIDEYSTAETVNLWAGTFNLNGRGKGTKEDLSAWLCPKINRSHQPAEIIAVGFQEIVELSPQQIMSTDPARRKEWELAVTRTLNEEARKRQSEYVLLRSGQLVGTALMIFVQSRVLRLIKNVEGSTGLSGMAGNKGAVAIRMDFANLRLCFVTAHLAAGFANYDERNRDYRTISHGLRFQRNRSIEDHNFVMWLGDFNYRIGLGDDKVRRLIETGDLGLLYQNDQLNIQMVAGNAFPFYKEARITFLPTYKYNNGTDEYDTSEKVRIPAWCDRILWKGDDNVVKQINYGTAPLRFSDHRPVYGTFVCAISVIDESAKDSLSREIYAQRRAEVGDTGANVRSSDVDDEDLMGYDAIAPGLPPASSDRRKWWLNNGLPARSNIADSHAGYMPNPDRTVNPFAASDQPNWITVPTSSDNSADQSTMANKSSPLQTPRTEPLRFGHDVARRFSDNNPVTDDAPVGTRLSSASSASPSSGMAQKHAPPVPKKPASLTVTGRNPSFSQQDSSFSVRRSRKIPPFQESPRLVGLSSVGWAPSPDRQRSIVQQSIDRFNDHRDAPTARLQKSRRSAGAETEEASQSPPAPPARPPLPSRSRNTTTSVVGLMDEEDGDWARGIPSLQPLRATERLKKRA